MACTGKSRSRSRWSRAPKSGCFNGIGSRPLGTWVANNPADRKEKPQPMRPRFPHTLTLVLILLAGQAFAAVFIVPPDQELVDSADAIVVGTAVDTQSMFANQDEIITRVFVGVEEVLKGSIDPRLTLEIIVEGGVVGDQAEIVSGAPIFNPGDRYVVFLQRHSGGYWVTYGLSLGRFAFATDSMNRGVLLRSAGPQEIFGWDVEGNRHREVPRGSQRFLRFIRDYLAGQD